MLTTLLAAALLHSPFSAAQAQQASGTNTSAATAEGVEILRRILVEALEREFQDKQETKVEAQGDQDVPFLVTTLWAGAGDQTVQHSRAFHLPGVGLFFAIDASLPVVKKVREEPKDKAQGGAEERDEWERIRREVRGNGTYALGFTRRLRLGGEEERGEIDPQAIERLIDLALRTCARHVGRIEGLAPGETVTLALRLSGQGRSWLRSMGGEHGLLRLGGVGKDEEESDPELPAGKNGVFSYTLNAGETAADQNLVIRIALSDLTALADGTSERLRQRAQINRY